MGYIEGLLAANEEIAIRSRQHWIGLARLFLTNLIFLVVLVALALFSGLVVPERLRAVALGVLILLAILPIFAFWLGYLQWWNEEYLVTNRRVIQAQGIFSKHVIDSSLDKINDVSLTQSFLGRILDYGNIEILTASEIGVNLLRMIASPVKFKMMMMNQKEMGGSSRGAVSGQGAPDVTMLIQQVEELHKQGILTDQEYREKKAQLLARM